MNKRQAKKARKKVVYPLCDEFGLLTMTVQEREEEIKRYVSYCQKHFKYKHYKDKNKMMSSAWYCFPIKSNISAIF